MTPPLKKVGHHLWKGMKPFPALVSFHTDPKDFKDGFATRQGRVSLGVLDTLTSPGGAECFITPV